MPAVEPPEALDEGAEDALGDGDEVAIAPPVDEVAVDEVAVAPPVDEVAVAPPALRTLKISDRDLRQVAELTSTSVAPAVFDDEVSTAHAHRFRRLLETARNLDEALVDHAYTPAQVQLRRVRRLVVVTTVAVLCVVGAIGLARKRAYDATATWMARYYTNRNFQGEPERTFDHDVNFDWGNDSPMRGIPADQFSVRWDVCLRTDEAQTLDVSLGSDDGSRIFVDGEKLIDNWRMQTQTWHHEHVPLEPGTHHVRVEYFEGGGAARMQLRLRSDGRPLEGELVRPTSPDDGC